MRALPRFGGRQEVDQVLSAARIVVAQSTGRGVQVRSVHEVAAGVPVPIGRETAVSVAVDPVDRRVSRLAVQVTWTSDGWVVRSLNRNGVLVHPWGLPSWPAQPTELLTAARVALRVVGDGDRQHWILLEDDTRTRVASPVRTSLDTDLEKPVRGLTGPQRDVLRALFADLLAWPPVAPSEPRQLKQVARLLGISVSGVQARLVEVRSKAEALGLGRQLPLTDPEYLYVLVRAGYLEPELDGAPAHIPSGGASS
jgi:hypothetical protein